MDKPTLKKTMITKICLLTEIDQFKDHYVRIITSLGIISGKISFADENNNILSQISEEFTKEYRKENSLDMDTTLFGNDGYIILRDVTIANGPYHSNLSELIVFFDQIVGITIGKDS